MTYPTAEAARRDALVLAAAFDHRLCFPRMTDGCFTAQCRQCHAQIFVSPWRHLWKISGRAIERSCGSLTAGKQRLYFHDHPAAQGMNGSERRKQARGPYHPQRTVRAPAVPQPIVHQLLRMFPAPVPGVIALSFFERLEPRCR